MKELVQLINNYFYSYSRSIQQNLQFYFLSFLLLIFLPDNAFSENGDLTKGSWNMLMRADYGFIIAHRPALEPLQQKKVSGFEFTFSKTTNGEKDWEKIYNFPTYGVTLAYFNLGSPDHLGYGIAVYPGIDFPLGKKNPEKGFHFRYGTGLGYIQKKFDRENNFKNAAIGSHINGIIHFDLHYETTISARSNLELSVGITHYSNGAYRLPNLGINIATFSLAYGVFSGERKTFTARTIPPFNKKSYVIVHAGGFPKEIYPPLGKKYFSAVVSTMWLKQVSYKSAWGLGADLFYDNSIKPRLEHIEEEVHSMDNFRPGIYAGYHLSVNNFGLMFNMGYYLYNAWEDDGNVYHRICLHYYFEKLFLCANLKTHYARADMVEFGIGYKFKSKSVKQ